MRLCLNQSITQLLKSNLDTSINALIFSARVVDETLGMLANREHNREAGPFVSRRWISYKPSWVTVIL